jgi:EAL domain-containing protein (putative c-di-GMP-specific phosphodiesterase class I)
MTSPLFVEGIPIHFDVTCGIAYGSGIDLVKQASLAILTARKSRTRKINVYTADSAVEESQREIIRATLLIKNAINEKRLIPYFQPIVNSRSETVVKYEALARIKEEGRIIAPAVFIEAAKASGFTPEITRSIINSSLEVIKERSEGLSINITVDDLSKGYLPKYLKDRTEKHGVDPRRVFLEIIESEGSIELYNYLDQIQYLRESGFGISIDDFGTEHSNFHRLASLEVDEIKIDGMFIKEIDVNVKSQNIVRSICEFARRVGVQVVAEHIHTPEVLATIREFDIGLLQGYLFGRPKARI